MDYKNIYLNAFSKKMKEIDSEVVSQVKAFKERNKNFTAVVNQIKKDLWEKEKHKKTSVLQNFSELYEKYTNRFNEYDSDHLTSYFKYDFEDLTKNYSKSSLEEFVAELGILESYSRASVNFSNSRNFLEAIYALNKNYENYTLDFDPNDSPENSDLFYEMQKERFPEYGQEPNFVKQDLLEIQKEELKEKKEPEEKKTEEPNLKPGSVFNKTEKRFILHLLYELLSQGSEMKATEFMRILHLSADIIDTSAEIKGNPPHYRQVLEGFSNDYPKNKKIALIKSVISKIQEYQVPKLKQILDDKLIATTKKK